MVITVVFTLLTSLLSEGKVKKKCEERAQICECKMVGSVPYDFIISRTFGNTAFMRFLGLALSLPLAFCGRVVQLSGNSSNYRSDFSGYCANLVAHRL